MHHLISQTVRFLTHYATLIQALGVTVTILFTMLNVVMIWRAAATTRKRFELARNEFELEWIPELYAEVVDVAQAPYAFEITNLGRTSVLIRTVIFCRFAGAAEHIKPFQHNIILHRGTTARLLATKFLLKYWSTY